MQRSNLYCHSIHSPVSIMLKYKHYDSKTICIVFGYSRHNPNSIWVQCYSYYTLIIHLLNTNILNKKNSKLLPFSHVQVSELVTVRMNECVRVRSVLNCTDITSRIYSCLVSSVPRIESEFFVTLTKILGMWFFWPPAVIKYVANIIFGVVLAVWMFKRDIIFVFRAEMSLVKVNKIFVSILKCLKKAT